MIVRRFPENPIIRHEMLGGSGRNINGPSLIRVPEWLPQPLGRYYLYFADHQGEYIRLACADHLAGPWRIVSGGSLRLEQTVCKGHVASPDVHVDHAEKKLIMYFHGDSDGGQRSFIAESKDGIHFMAQPEPLGPFYFRVFRSQGFVFALAKTDPDCMLLRAAQWCGPFAEGPHLLSRVRHTALFCENEVLTVFCSRIGDAPEAILQTRISLAADWRHWRDGAYERVLSPERDYEGASLPLTPSSPGKAAGPVNQLRDPCIFKENGRTYLLYTVAGEQGIALVELIE